MAQNDPIGFDQDPDLPEGVGTFRFSDGSELYAGDPELARRVRGALGPDQRTASNAHAPRSDVRTGRPADPFAEFNAQRSDAPAQPQGPRGLEAMLGVQGSDEGLPAHLRPTPVQSGAAPRAGAEVAPADRTAFVQALAGGGAPPPATPQPRQVPRPWVGGRDPAREAATAVPVPRGTTVTMEGTGAPYSEEDAEARADLNVNYVQAKLAEYETTIARATEERARLQASIPSLQQEESRQRAALSNLEAVYKHERLTVQKRIAEFDQQAKPDPNRLFKNAGTFANVAMVIGQALGAYASTLTGSENFAQKILDQALERDYQEQLDEIRAGRVSNDNMLARLGEQFGDVEQARTALKLIHGEIVDREIRSYAAAAKSVDAENAANVWLAQRQQERLAEEQKFRDQSIGKITRTTTADMVVPRSGRRMTDDEILERQLKSNKLRAGVLESENELGFQRQGGEQADKLAKRQAAGREDEERYVEGYGFAKSAQEARDLRELKAAHQVTMSKLDEAERLNATGWSAVGLGDVGSDEYVRAKNLRAELVTAMAKQMSGGGPLTEPDVARAQELVPDPSSLFSGTQRSRINQLRETSTIQLNERIKERVSGRHPELPTPRRGEDR